MSTPYEQCSGADLSWEGDIPASKAYGDVYFSLVDGLEESQYVFIDANDLPHKLKKTAEHTPPFLIAEAGFGTGLNFLLAWQSWLGIAPTERRNLHFISFEKHPIKSQDLALSLAQWPQLSALSKQLQEQYPLLIKGQHTLEFESGQVVLSLVFGDINEELPNYQFRADCWFFDGFSPNKNPDMWSTSLFSEAMRLSATNATFSTFAAASSVRKSLQSAGFDVRKRKGYGKKREMLFGHTVDALCREPQGSRSSRLCINNWSLPEPTHQQDLPPNNVSNCTHCDFDVIVVGAGLAGVSTAYALRKRGLKVGLLEERPQAVSGASGQSQLVMYAKLPSERNKTFNFIEHCLSHSMRYYARKQRDAIDKTFWHDCGLLQLAWNEKEAVKQARFAANNSLPKEFISIISAREASLKTGLRHKCGGLWFENAGWLEPRIYSETLLNTPNNSSGRIDQYYNERVLSFTRSSNETWEVETSQRNLRTRTLVITNSNDAKRFPQLSHLPSKPLRGQVTSIKAKAESSGIPSLKCVVTGEGYLCPPLNDWHHFGATFNLDSSDTADNPLDNEKNFTSMQRWNPSWLKAKSATLSLNDYQVKANAGLRCTTPDYLPIIGKAPIYEDMVKTFAKTRVDANSCRDKYGHYYNGLYVNIGHGSKGVFTTPVGAELIANEICGGCPPLNEPLRTMLSPARFITKHLKQRRI